MKISQLGEFPSVVDEAAQDCVIKFLFTHQLISKAVLGGYKACLSVVSVYVLMLTDLRLIAKYVKDIIVQHFRVCSTFVYRNVFDSPPKNYFVVQLVVRSSKI